MATLKMIDEPDGISTATRGEVADYLYDLIEDLIIIATSAGLTRVAGHLNAASLEVEQELERPSLAS